jgi:demethylmenaquinone methyltransferase/2-methoxy-6-polyprenyl-1,4-benzoquinol methylase
VPVFARDPVTAEYYDRRAGEYDDWYAGVGRFADRDRPGWSAEVDRLVEFVRSLSPARTLDVACGSGFLTRHLHGPLVVGVDQSPAMVGVARERVAGGVVVITNALALPFTDGAFDRIVTGHFYGHLPADERRVFLAECRRVGRELIVIDSALRPGIEPEQWPERMLNDGSRYRIYKRYLSAGQLAAEIGGEVELDGTWFVAAKAAPPRSRRS